MYLEVYVDVIFLINFCMDLILLHIVKIILKYSTTKLRMFFGSVIGAFGACILAIVPNLYGVFQFLFAYVVICIVMIYVTYYQVNWKSRMKAIMVLYLVTFFLGGVINSLYYHSRLGYYFLEIMNGKLFQNRNVTYFAVLMFAGFFALQVLIHTLHNLRSGKRELYHTELFYGVKSVQVVGLLDTGNSLYDPIYGKPVIITDYSVIEPLITKAQSSQLNVMLDMAEGNGDVVTSKKSTVGDFAEYAMGEERLNIMMIPFHSIGKKNGMLPSIVLNRIVIRDGEEQISNDKVLTAVCRNRLSRNNEYQVILHRDMM